MTCQKCRAKIIISHRPGQFLMIASGAGVGALAAGFIWSGVTGLIVQIALGYIALVAMCGVWTQMTDASAWVFYKHCRQGVECKTCGHITPIRPWSL